MAIHMDFVGKVYRGDWDQPVKRMLSASYSHTQLKGRPNYQIKYALIKNLKLLFTQVSNMVIDNTGSRLTKGLNQ